MLVRALMVAGCAWALAAQANVPTYKLGDVATEDVATPVALTVINPANTEALQRKEAQKIPPVVRFRSQTAEEAEAALRAAFTNVRTNFMDVLYRTMKDKPDKARAIDGPAFKRAVETTRRSSDRFPLLNQLAPVWARDESDAAIQAELAAKLRAVMSRPIIPEKPTITGLGSLRLVPVSQLEQSLTPDDVAQFGQTVKTNPLVLAVARSQLVKSFNTNEISVARFLARFLTNNALLDEDLTQLLRARHIEGMAVLDQYQPADLVVTQGQVIDQQALATLAALREKSLIGTLQTQLVQEKSVITETRQNNRWLAGGLLAFAILGVLAFWRVRARPPQIGLPAAVGTRAGTPAQLAWEERALRAEAQAEQARLTLRSGFMHWMRERIVQGLFHQRKALLSTQQRAEAEMQVLEQRLEQLHAPLQERISAYEKRITELERDLAVKGEENRELIKAKIVLAKHQLAVERERGVSRFGVN